MGVKNILRILVWLIFILGGLVLAGYLDNYIFGCYGVLPHKFAFGLRLMGIMLLAWVFRTTGKVGRALAKYGRSSKDLPRMQTDTLAKTGIYALMRHPMHLVLFFFPFAFAFLSASCSFIFIIAPLEVVLMLLMIIWIEEPEARKKFGKDYDEYCAVTPRFCLKWHCLRALMTENYKEE